MVTKFQRAQSYTIFSRPGLVLEDVLSFDFWAHVAHQLKLNDLISVVALDDTFDVTLRVVRLENNSIEFRILHEWRPEIDEAADDVSAIEPTTDFAHVAVRQPETGSRHAA